MRTAAPLPPHDPLRGFDKGYSGRGACRHVVRESLTHDECLDAVQQSEYPMLEDYDFPISISFEELDKDGLKFKVSHTRIAGAERITGG